MSLKYICKFSNITTKYFTTTSTPPSIISQANRYVHNLYWKINYIKILDHYFFHLKFFVKFPIHIPGIFKISLGWCVFSTEFNCKIVVEQEEEQLTSNERTLVFTMFYSFNMFNVKLSLGYWCLLRFGRARMEDDVVVNMLFIHIGCLCVRLCISLVFSMDIVCLFRVDFC